MAAITTDQHGHGGHGEPGVDYIRNKKGLMSWLITLDHKRIGVMYLISVMVFFVFAGVMALLVRAELFTPGRTIMDPDTYNRVFTLHGVVMVFLFIIPAVPAAL